MGHYTWLVYAVLGAVCAALLNLTAKVGLKGVNSDLATAIRSIVQAGFVIAFAAVVGVFRHVGELQGNVKAYVSVVLAGVLGGLSWIFMFRALSLADVSKVSPVDKLSMPLGIVLAVLFLRERPSGVNWIGIVLIVAGTYLASKSRPA
jgi:bacterial/archaeal transporter family protein